MLNASTLAVFYDPTALSIVGGGTLIATALRGPIADTVRAFQALAVLLRPRFDIAFARAELAGSERIAKAKSVMALDPKTMRDRDVAAAVEAITAGARPDDMATLLGRLRAERVERHGVVQDFWTAAAETAPAMGMVGTLIGLVALFRSMDDPAAIGGAMAVALLATLYGALFANLIAAPIAARLRRLSRAEEIARRKLVQPMTAFAARETPPILRRDLEAA